MTRRSRIRAGALVLMGTACAVCNGGLWPGESDDLGPERRPLPVPGAGAPEDAPILAMWESDPWLQVVGSDVPAFVLYRDGLVIYRRGEGDGARRYVARVEGRGRPEDIVERAVRRGFARVPPSSSLVDGTDQPTVSIVLRHDEGWLGADVYGLGRNGWPTAGCPIERRPPAPFLRTYRELVAFRAPSERIWEPEQLEVMLWAFSPSAGRTLPWPDGLPRPPAGFEVPEGRTFRYSVDGQHRARLAELSRALGSSRAVTLDEGTFAMSFRPLVPSEGYLFAVRRALEMIP